MAKAKPRGQARVGPPVAFVLALSTPSTDMRARPSGSSEPRGTSRKSLVGPMAQPVLLSKEGPSDRGVH